MGQFFTSIQIFNKNRLSEDSFLEMFREKMKKNGYSVCNESEADIIYAINYGENWVSIISEEEFASKETGRIAKMLKAPCLSTTVIDSDYAMIELISASGKKSDIMIMGRADDYFGDEIPQPSEKKWIQFLAEGSTWEQLVEIISGDYVFVEEGLVKLADILGMKNDQICSEEPGDNTVCLYFRKSIVTKEKKLSLNTAFIRIFGEALEPLGFVKIKSKHPYFVRVVNGEILHVITFDKDSRSEFGLFGGIATLYRKTIDFDQNVLNNLSSMNDIAQFYYYSEPYKKNKPLFSRSYSFSPGDNDSIEHSILESLSHTMQYIIPVMDSIVSLRDCVDHFLIYQSPILRILLDEEELSGCNEGLIYFKIDDHSDMTHEFTKYLECHKRFTNYDVLFNHAEAYRKEQLRKRDRFYNDKELYEKVMQELSRNKARNIEKLQSYGLSIDEI